MNLTTKIFKTFTIIVIAQLAVVGLWAISLYSSKDGQYPASIVTSLTKVDRSILEGIMLQNRIGSSLARDLVAYKLLELNNVDSAEFIKPTKISSLISKLGLKNCISQAETTLCSRPDNKVVVSLIPLRIGESLEGYLKLEKSLKLVEEVNKKILVTIGATVLVVFFINVFTLIMLWWKFLRPETSRLIKAIEDEKEDPTIMIAEYKKIQDSFLLAMSRVKKAEAELQKMNLATQVAHDIRSPLEVLKSLKDEMASLPEDSRKRVKLSINRIEEITFNLLKTYKHSTALPQEMKSEELLSLVLSVVTEKNIEYRNHPGVEIITDFGPESYGLFSKIGRNTLKSVISNLINNAVEAFDEKKGSIHLNLITGPSGNSLIISDNGPGISPDIRERLFSKGFTTKSEGNGLGLFNAKNDIEAAGGSIHLESEPGKGTTFTITLPTSRSPEIFASDINTSNFDKIIILDDDPAFHEVWLNRLNCPEKIEHYYSVAGFFLKYESLDSKTLLLSDFELMDKNFDGIDVIQKLNHAEHSLLVTARNEELAIQSRCQASKIKLLPKSLVNYITIFKGDKNEEGIILIDDDRLIHLNWSAYCKKNELSFLGFKSVDEFLKSSSDLNKSSRIYVDSNLGEDIRGEVESEKIFNLGFANLYIVTGYEKESIPKPAWIKAIYSKSIANIFQ